MTMMTKWVQMLQTVIIKGEDDAGAGELMTNLSCCAVAEEHISDLWPLHVPMTKGANYTENVIFTLQSYFASFCTFYVSIKFAAFTEDGCLPGSIVLAQQHKKYIPLFHD